MDTWIPWIFRQLLLETTQTNFLNRKRVWIIPQQKDTIYLLKTGWSEEYVTLSPGYDQSFMCWAQNIPHVNTMAADAPASCVT